MPSEVLGVFPRPPGLPQDKSAYLRSIDEVYRSDAYHTLSIEGYSVSEGLIERVKSGDWDPTGGRMTLAVMPGAFHTGLLKTHFALAPSDPLTIVCATLVLFAAGAVAGFLSARRVASVEPALALRSD